jgi:DNA-binding CsgD family transcriptional regulator
MKHCNDIAYLRQLCCLGLGREIVIPEFLKAVQSVIPSDNNFFTGINQNGDPNYYLTELFVPNLQEKAAEVMPGFFTREKKSYVFDYLRRYSAITDHHVLDERFFQTDLYNNLWHPWDLYHFILAPVIVNGRLAGMFFLFRPPEVHSFTPSEQALCLQLLPYIAHALQERKVKDTEYVNSGQSCLVIADKQGTIIHLSSSAKRLLNLAAEQNVKKGNPLKNPVLPSALVRLCRNLNAVFKGEDVSPPLLVHTNSVGRFVFRAYLLDQVNDGGDGLIGITIEHQEPVMLKITRNLQFQPLSATEKEVALLWSQGYNYDKVGQHLHIKTTTVRSHINNIYGKLDINNRSQLIAKLSP